MKLLIFVILLIVISFFVYRLFFFKPRFRRMFKRRSERNRVSISYAILFDTKKVAKVVKKKLDKADKTLLCIEAYHVRKCFDVNQSLEEIEQVIISFQNQLSEDIIFSNLYYKDLYEILIEIWIKYSRYENYRKLCLRNLYVLYKMRREINLICFVRLLLILCGF